MRFALLGLACGNTRVLYWTVEYEGVMYVANVAHPVGPYCGLYRTRVTEPFSAMPYCTVAYRTYHGNSDTMHLKGNPSLPRPSTAAPAARRATQIHCSTSPLWHAWRSCSKQCSSQIRHACANVVLVTKRMDVVPLLRRLCIVEAIVRYQYSTHLL